MKKTVSKARKTVHRRRTRKQSQRSQAKFIVGLCLLALIGVAGLLYFVQHHTASKADVLSASVIAGKTWVPVFTDNFDGNSLDTSRWATYFNTYGDSNNEEACLTPNNVSVSNGTLKITAKRETITCPGQPTDSFSSGFISTREKNIYFPAFSRFEIRAKLPHGQGLWPAFWLRHINGASTAELDVMEYFHAQVPGSTTQTLHFPNEIGTNVAKKTTFFETPTTLPGWHTWAVEIIPTNAAGTTAKIRMFTDDVMTLEYTPTKFGWLNNYDQSKLFDMAINLAVSGTYVGHPDDALGYSRYTGKCLKPYNGTPPCNANNILRASFPATYEVDYVSVSELEDTPSTPTGSGSGTSSGSGGATGSGTSGSSNDTSTSAPSTGQSTTSNTAGSPSQSSTGNANQQTSNTPGTSTATTTERLPGGSLPSKEPTSVVHELRSSKVAYTTGTVTVLLTALLSYIFRRKLFTLFRKLKSTV